MNIVFSPKYSIGNKIYHVLPESPQGIITDITYRHSARKFFYEVTFDPGSHGFTYEEFELTTEKNII